MGTGETPPAQGVLRRAGLLGILAGALLLSACGGHRTARSQPVPPPPALTPSPLAPETAEAANTPQSLRRARPIYVETGMASWYGPPYHNRRGADGKIYNEHAMTAAHRTLPLHSEVRVTNLSTGRSAIVRITDRGPFVGDRIIDLSLAAAKAVDVWQPGTAEVRLEVLSSPAPIFQGGRWCVQIGAFHSKRAAHKLEKKLQNRYENANVIAFTGPTGEWVRIRPPGDDKRQAEEVASKTHVKEGGVFLVRLD